MSEISDQLVVTCMVSITIIVDPFPSFILVVGGKGKGLAIQTPTTCTQHYIITNLHHSSLVSYFHIVIALYARLC